MRSESDTSDKLGDASVDYFKNYGSAKRKQSVLDPASTASASATTSVPNSGVPPPRPPPKKPPKPGQAFLSAIQAAVSASATQPVSATSTATATSTSTAPAVAVDPSPAVAPSQPSRPTDVTPLVDAIADAKLDAPVPAPAPAPASAVASAPTVDDVAAVSALLTPAGGPAAKPPSPPTMPVVVTSDALVSGVPPPNSPIPESPAVEVAVAKPSADAASVTSSQSSKQSLFQRSASMPSKKLPPAAGSEDFAVFDPSAKLKPATATASATEPPGINPRKSIRFADQSSSSLLPDEAALQPPPSDDQAPVSPTLTRRPVSSSIAASRWSNVRTVVHSGLVGGKTYEECCELLRVSTLSVCSCDSAMVHVLMFGVLWCVSA